MAFLVVAGITVGVQADSAEKRVVRIGSSSRAFAGNLRSQTRAEKREWTVTTSPMSDGDAATLEAAIDLGAQVTCSGDLLGGSITCEVEATQSAYLATPGSFKRRLTLVVREV